MNERRATLVVIAVCALSALLWLDPGVLKPDGVGYVMYLQSAWLDHDLVFFDEWQQFGLIHDGNIDFKDVTANGHLGNHWTVGSALIWLPLFASGELLRFLTPGVGPDGVSLPYLLPVLVTSAAAGVVALLVGMSIARRYFDETSALVATIAIWFGSPLIWYSLRHPSMSHAISAAVCALFVKLSLRLRDAITPERLFSAGLALGLAFAVGPPNAPIALVPLLLVERRALRELARKGGWAVVGALIGALPQFVVSNVLWNAPLAFMNIGGAERANEWNSLQRINLIETLFSSWHGLVPWTPILAVAIAGFVMLHRDDPGLARAAIVSFVIQWLLVSLLDRAFWGGASFGQRRFDNCTVFFIVGLAAVFARLPRWTSLAIAALGSAWTMSLFLAARRLNLNAFQTQRELLDAQLSALANGDGLAFLAFVPSRAKLTVLVLMLIISALLALFALVALRAARRPPLLAAGVASYLIACAALLAWCGTHDAVRINDHRDLIALQRRGQRVPGSVMNTFNALLHELHYLRRTGQDDDAERTRQEAAELARRYRILR